MMKLLPYIFILTGLFFVFLGINSKIYAQPIPLPPPPAKLDVRFTAYPLNQLPSEIVSAIFPAVIVILGFIAVYYMVLASIRLIISRGDPEKVAEARSRLIYAVVGFIVLLLAFAALQIINRIFLGSSVA